MGLQAGRTVGCALSVGGEPSQSLGTLQQSDRLAPIHGGRIFSGEEHVDPCNCQFPRQNSRRVWGLSAACAVQALSENASPVGEILWGDAVPTGVMVWHRSSY